MLQGLVPAKSNRTKGTRSLKKGGEASLLGSCHFLHDQNYFSTMVRTDCTYTCTYVVSNVLQDQADRVDHPLDNTVTVRP
jgi:hypothetical protein